MTTTIDNKVVEMAFQNSEFEKNVGTSIGTLDKLKRSLNFGDASKSFDGITKAANGVDLSSIGNGINTIANRFSALGIVAITTLVNITNSAINAGKRIASALTIDPIRTGLQEYETKLNSVQTILANTQKEGTDLKTVTKALNELNTYSDKTIYNFQQMTRNVGTFTAAGVKLDTSVAAIKGIANLAAISGSNADQASTAMYQLSQALSTGTVRLMDWNSVVNAGMGGQVFQDAIKETARLHGVAIDQIIKDEGSFRDSLQKGWFTSEILTETLAKFTGDLNADQLRTMGYTEEQIASIIKMGQTANDAATKVKTFTQLFDTLKEAAQSGWAQTWEILIGDFEEAKSFLTDLNNWFGGILGATADARNQMLQGWKDLGGRTKLIESFRNVLNSIILVINPIKEAMREIFPPMTAQRLLEITENVRKFTERLIISSETADKIKRIFKGVFAVLDIGRMAFAAIGKVIFGFGEQLGPPIGSLTDFLARVGDFLVNLRDGIKTTNAFGVAISNIGKFFTPIIEIAKKFFSSFSEGLSSFKGIKLDGLSTFMSNLKIRFEPLSQLANLIGKFLGLIGTLLSKLAPIALKLGSVVAEGVGSFIDRITLALENFEPEKVFDIINGGLLAGILLAIRKFINKGSTMFDGVKDVLNGVRGSLEAWQASLKADVLLKIAAALGILTVSVIALSMIDSARLTTALTGMTVMFVQLGLSLSAYQKVSDSVNPIQMAKMATGLIAVSGAILIMSLAVSNLAKLDAGQLTRGLIAITALVGISKLAADTLAKSSGSMITGALALTVFSFSIRSLTVAVRTLGDIDTGALTQGLIGVGVLVTELALFMRATNLSGLGVIKSVGILILAGAVNLLAIAVGKLAEIDSDNIAKGLFAMGVILGELTAFTALTGGGATLILTAAGVGVISVAMLIFAGVMERFANLSWEGVAKGLVAMAGALTLIGAASYLISPTLIVQAAGLVVMAGALVILSDALTTMGDMQWEEIGRGLLAMAGSLTILAVAMMAMQGSIVGAAAIFVASAALLALAPALKILGSMSLEEIGRGLLALAGVFLVLGVAGAVLTPVIPTLLGLGAAMALIGVAMVAAGIGILAFSAGLAALAVSGAAGGAALVTIITSIVGLVPMLVRTLGRAILALIDVLVAGAPTLLEGVITLLNIILDGLLEIGPKLVDTVMTLLDSLLTALESRLPDMIASGYNIIISLLKGFRDNIGEIATIGYEAMENLLRAIAEKIPDIIDAGWNLIISWIDGMTASVEENMPRLIQSVQELGLAIVKGVVTGLIQGHKDARAGILEVGRILVDGFKSYLGINSPSSVFMGLTLDVIRGIVNSLKNNANMVVTAILDIGKKMIDNFKGNVSNFYNAGRDLVQGLANGVKDYISTAVNAAANLAKSVLDKIRSTLGIKSPSKETFAMGKFADQGLAGGITKFAGVVLKSIQDLGNQAISGFGNVVSKISSSLDSGMDVNPTIRPVLDLSEIEAGGSKIENLLGGKKLNLSLATIKASNVSTPGQTVSDASTQQTGNAPSIKFEQNNYSPKALSRIEIYRQTKNALSQAKELVGAS